MEIPTKIYHLVEGTIEQLHHRFNDEYGQIERKVFIDYTRELVKQGIMIPINE